MTQGHSSATKWTLGILATLILYVLSEGPGVYLPLKYGSSSPSLGWISTVYAPVHVLYRTPLRDPLVAYRRWWMELAMKDPEVRRKLDLKIK